MGYRGGRGRDQRQRSPARRVVSAGSPSDGTLSSRFAKIHSERRGESSGRRGGHLGRVDKSTGRRGGRGPAAMDIDSVGSSGPDGGRRGGRSDRRGGRGGSRGGRGGRRGRGGHIGGHNKQSMSKDALDNDLDNYMMKDESVAKTRLDQEMDAYQQARAN